jgi:hypothetical protein
MRAAAMPGSSPDRRSNWSRRRLIPALLAVVLGAPNAIPAHRALASSAADGDGRTPPPLALRIDAIGVDAVVEAGDVVGGALSEPSGPWVVRWYRETARPSERANMVIGGHVDYWNVGPAVFWRLGSLSPGAEIDVTDMANSQFIYVVSWLKTFSAADLTTQQLREIVGPTPFPSLTLITCAGAFDATTGRYPSRLVVRASRVVD